MKPFEVQNTVYMRYQDSIGIGAIVDTIGWIDAAKDINAILDYVMNFQSSTIGTFGLDIYGELLNFRRAFPVISKNYFGFYGSDLQPFSQAPFFRGIFEEIKNIIMSNDYYKLLLKALFLSVWFDGTLYSINKIINELFGYRGKIAVIRDNGDLNIVHDFQLENWEKSLFEFGIIPMPMATGFKFTRSDL